jgi:hypothetical protein
MSSRRLFSFAIFFALVVLLSGCSESLKRDNEAAKAKAQMIGLSKEDVLACMGPPKKKAKEGSTEVWQFLSTDGRSVRSGGSYGFGGRTKTSSVSSSSDWLGLSSSSGGKRFCTVNIVMKDGVVTRVNYLGPTATSFYNDNDQCGYAVAACVR